jgi:hypothetical protein
MLDDKSLALVKDIRDYIRGSIIHNIEDYDIVREVLQRINRSGVLSSTSTVEDPKPQGVEIRTTPPAKKII